MKKLLVLIPLCLLLCFACSSSQQAEGVGAETVENIETSGDAPKPLNIEKSSFSYSTEGTGIPCVVFLGSEKAGLRFFPKELKNHIRFIHAGHISKEKAENMTMDTIVDDIEKVRIALGLEKIAVLGHSMFSLIPPEYGIKYPDGASHLIITGGVPYISEKQGIASRLYFENEASEERKEILERNFSALTEEVMSKLSPSEAFIRRYIASVPRYFRDPEYDMSGYWDGIELNMDFINRYGEFTRGVDHTDQFHRIKAPVLVISGRYDFWAVYTLWDDVKKKNPDFTFVLFENAGHNPMLEIPEEFNRTLIDWLKSH